jgi:hypothetical protein
MHFYLFFLFLIFEIYSQYVRACFENYKNSKSVARYRVFSLGHLSLDERLLSNLSSDERSHNVSSSKDERSPNVNLSSDERLNFEL